MMLAGFGFAQQWELRVCADSANLPYSNRALQGFDNRIISLLAKEMGAKVVYDWWTQSPAMVHFRLREGLCDVMLGVGESYEGLLSTLAYYQSSFAFIYRADSPYEITSMDDEVLKTLKIAIESAGTPTFEALTKRGLSREARIFEAVDRTKLPHWSPLVEAVAKGEVDVGLVWGPIAGYFARKQSVKLKVIPVQPEFEPPALSMVYPMTLGVRQGDEALKDQLNIAIVKRWDQIIKVLEEYSTPVIPLPKPELEVR